MRMLLNCNAGLRRSSLTIQMRMILDCNSPVQMRMLRSCNNYPDANDYHCHHTSMQLPCQVVDNDYHLQSYRFHKLAHILHMHNLCHYLCSFCISAMQKYQWYLPPKYALKGVGKNPENPMLHRTINIAPQHNQLPKVTQSKETTT